MGFASRFLNASPTSGPTWEPPAFGWSTRNPLVHEPPPKGNLETETRMKVAVIDYGMGNLHSVHKAVEKMAKEVDPSIEAILTDDAKVVREADRVVFPGQGAMADCMKALKASGLGESVEEAFRNKPFFGICVGAQLLLTHSEEGDSMALGHYKGEVRRFTKTSDGNGEKLKIPHMGWNEVEFVKDHPVFKGVESGSLFYFVHSYYLDPEDRDIVLGMSRYPDQFASIIGRDNVIATQFHPEKSSTNGLRLIKNFIEWKV